MRKPIIYIAGPVQSNEKAPIETNIRRGYAETRIFLCSYDVLCVSPYLLNKTLLDLDLFSKYTFDQFMDYSYRLLSVCDALFTLTNWNYSKGTKLEINYAKALNIPVFHYESELIQFIKRAKYNPDK